ncbi:MAG: delta-lactam-biosynthetic de-N-acetylase [Ruminococcaceae bacterium]|nr:delta-lactam-biosynthetic de-N-acetylase [Oscillospiraceae bacterium]
MKKSLMLGLIALLLCFSAIAASAKGALSWYTSPNKEHKQALAAPELRFVEEFGGYYIDHTHGDENAERVVYLTFDAGYENGNVERVLNALRDTETPGAFFLLKHFVEANTGLVERMQREGHLVCNHTASHKNLSDASFEAIQSEIKALEVAVLKATGKGCASYFRPPEGKFSREMLTAVERLGYKTIFWSFAYADWDNDRQMAPDAALERILAHVHNGAVLLLHPTSATNAAILPELIGRLRAEGYRFGTLDELCGAG